ncbi:MAG TPA: hypothetical protein DCL15_20795 [Chloroflexi bacterium]|nr:hypothetical protein [Chloroflexota bacterium]
MAAALLVLCCLTASGALAPQRVQAQRTPMVTHNNGWTFVDVARVGQNGFTQLSAGRAGPEGAVVVSGVRNGRTGLFHIQGGTVTEVATEGTVLPGGLGTLSNVGASAFRYAILPDGDVVFVASATGGSLNPQFRYAFRWRNGVITLAQPSTEIDPATQNQAFDHDLQQVTTDGRWLATLTSGTFPNTTTDYGLTDGTTRQSLFTFTRSSAGCVDDLVERAAANGEDVLATNREVRTRTANGSACGEPANTAWSINLAGGATGTLASGASSSNGNTRTGTELSLNSLFLVNNQNQVAAVREIYNAPATFRVREQLVIFSGSGETIIQDTDGPVDGIFLSDFDQEGRVLYSVSLDANPIATVLLGGPSLDTDRVVGPGDALFGQTVTGVGWVARPAAVAGEGRAFAFNYGLDDGARGIALATQSPPEWNNPNGGDWGAADNWTPAVVPGVADEVRFNLSAEYAVNLGTHQVGDVSIQKGEVTFRNGELTLPNAGSQLGVGALTPGNRPLLTIAGAATVVTAPAVAVGASGPGELRIESATLNYPEGSNDAVGAILGFTAPATATVTAGGAWLWPELALGLTHDALLRVEAGAVAGFASDRLFVGGSVLGLALGNGTGRVVVDNTADAGGKLDLGTLLGPVRELVIGEALIGRLEVTNGGHALAVTTTVGTRDHGATTDGFLTVEGTTATRTALFTSGEQDRGGLFVATGNGTDALVTVSAGGAMSLTQLSLADGAQSNALMFVDGMEAAADGDRRSTVIAPLPAPAPEVRAAAQNPDNGNCVVGRAGRGTLNVSNGALLRCRQLAVGFNGGSRGEMNIDGLFRAVPAQVVVAGPRAEDGVMCIGRVPLCGGSGNNVRGDVILGADGQLEARIVGIGNGGRLRGSGILIAADGVVAFKGGSIAPGIVQINRMERIADATHQVGTLTIQGNVTISPTGVITLHVLGGTADLQDRLVVSGTVNLAGDLAIHFGNGYAPKQGDQLALIQATTINGAAQNVVITGLEPGFDFTLAAPGGVLTLTALNDGVATTPASGAAIFLPLVTKSW